MEIKFVKYWGMMCRECALIGYAQIMGAEYRLAFDNVWHFPFFEADSVGKAISYDFRIEEGMVSALGLELEQLDKNSDFKVFRAGNDKFLVEADQYYCHWHRYYRSWHHPHSFLIDRLIGNKYAIADPMMSERYIEVDKDDILWDTLTDIERVSLKGKPNGIDKRQIIINSAERIIRDEALYGKLIAFLESMREIDLKKELDGIEHNSVDILLYRNLMRIAQGRDAFIKALLIDSGIDTSEMLETIDAIHFYRHGIVKAYLKGETTCSVLPLMKLIRRLKESDLRLARRIIA